MFQEVGIDLVGDSRFRIPGSDAGLAPAGQDGGEGWCAGQRVVPSDAPITCEVLTCATSVRG